MSNFHLIRLTVNNAHLLLVDPTSKPRYMCFVEPGVAEDCINHIARFRSNHGIWPHFDMSRGKKRIEAKNRGSYESPETIAKYMDIDTYTMDDIDRIARKTNISFYNILTFESVYDEVKENVNFTGLEFDGYADPVEYIELLEISLKMN